ncbi:MobF family relaxase [Bosea eneae]|uniref:MobF family relaxase n=1 Tax=Bosea eneae TaxID=151454 RepID=A0ABW0J1X2_9HYPH
MVATWNPAAHSGYYLRAAEYYLGGREPAGRWYAPKKDFGLVDGTLVERPTFERLYAAVGPDGQTLLPKGARHENRVPAFDMTMSAPRSVTLAWAFATSGQKTAIEAAQERAVRAALARLEAEAIFARRGRNGAIIEPVGLTAALFQHGESRPAAHANGRVFGDPNLHTHATILNLATRADGTVGAIHSKVLRDWKMAAGATYHAALAHELQKLGFAIDRIGRNGTFEIAGVGEAAIRYFSARRAEIEEELAEHDLPSAEASALASAIAKSTRASKSSDTADSREEIWREAAAAIGINPDSFHDALRAKAEASAIREAEALLADRLTRLPDELTEHDSVIDRRELVRAVTATLVGTGLPAERTDRELDRLLAEQAFIEIGRDTLGNRQYSTPELARIEHEIVDLAQKLAATGPASIDRAALEARCRTDGLNDDQIKAAIAATGPERLVIVEGAPGSGKTTTLLPVVDAYRQAGFRVIGSASAWTIARMLRADLKIEARATRSWIAKLRLGHKVLDDRTVLVLDEAGLVSAREMHTVLAAVERAGAKLVLVGDRDQLQAIGAGPGLALAARAIDSARVETIVRQHDEWAREAIRAFGEGRAETALQAFAERGHIVEAAGPRATIAAMVDAWQGTRHETPGSRALLLAKTNAQVAAISREVRVRRRQRGELRGIDAEIAAATPSGHATTLHLAAGDEIRFLVRNDELGVVNGTIGVVSRIVRNPGLRLPGGSAIRIEARVEGRFISFDPAELADAKGRARLGWAYASTIAGSQGQTVESAFVLADPSFDRHDAYVSTSRARGQTRLFVDTTSIDRHLQAQQPLGRQDTPVKVDSDARRRWLAERLSRANYKRSALAVIEASRSGIGHDSARHHPSAEFSHELG